VVVYDLKNAAVGGRAKPIGTGLNPRENPLPLPEKKDARDDQSSGNTFHSKGEKAAFDTPRLESETDAKYYQRMDKLHWS
jgi:hypothetical protein